MGLLIGAERERRKRRRATVSAAGLRTFSVAALAGALSLQVGGALLLAITTASAGVLMAISYWRQRADDDPGVTTEVALVFTVLAGALAVQSPALAAGVGVVAAILLAGRTPLHHFVGSVVTEREGRDGLLLAGATLVVLPLLPDRGVGPFGALNPHAIWLVVVLVLAIGGAGHIAVRALGPRYGLPVIGLASGFISSTATIGAFGARAAKAPASLPTAAAAAVLSTLATVVEMALVVAATSLPTLSALSVPLVCAGLAAAGYGAAITVIALRRPFGPEPEADQAFSLATALIFAGTLCVVLVVSAALRDRFGAAGVVAASALAGLADTHASAISIASIVASGRMAPADAAVPILAGLTTNTLSKTILAATAGGRAFALRVIPGLWLVVAAAWLGAVAAGLGGRC